jgi:hypothetical protein
MKNIIRITAVLLALGASAWTVTAQEQGGQPERGRPPGPGGEMRGERPPPSPLIHALDANRDGVIDETEIANASAALRTLDKNGDGKLTREELRPPRPEGVQRPEGPGRPGPGPGREPRGPGGPGGPARGPQGR